MRLLQEQELGAGESKRWMEVNLVQVQMHVHVTVLDSASGSIQRVGWLKRK